MDETKERSKTFLEQFDFHLLEPHYFEELESSFWDTENIMTKKYKAKRDKIIKNEIEGDVQSLEKAYKILTTMKTRAQYCKFLMYQYTLSQPLNMDSLIDKYYSIIFPFYLFPLKTDKDDNKYLVLDNMNFSINHYEKNALKNSFEVDTIEDIKINFDDNSIKIKIIKTKNLIIFYPQVEEHLRLLYALIIFMGLIKKRKDNWKNDQSKVNEINQNLVKESFKTLFDKNENLGKKIDDFRLLSLSNDNFIPKGIKYASYVQEKSGGTKKFLVLGSSYIYLFKDQEMKDILNIIPLIPGMTMFEFIEKEKNIKISSGSKEFSFYLNKVETFSKIQSIVLNISEGEENLFNDEDIVKVSEALYKDKIMGRELKDTPLFFKSQKQISLLELKIEHLIRAKKKAEEKIISFDEKNINNNSINNSIDNTNDNNKDSDNNNLDNNINIDDNKVNDNQNDGNNNNN